MAPRAGGDNQLDQLGTGSFINEELGTIKGVEGATQISAGFVHACALRAGRVLCWEPQDPVGHAEPPVAVAGITDAVQLSSGVRHDCAVLASKRVACWGDPFIGVLGDGSDSPSQQAVLAVGVTDAVEVAAGGDHTCARLSTGTVMCWGENERGLLGIGRRDKRQLVPAEVLGIHDAVELAVGASTTCARRATGAVACWGSNRPRASGTSSTRRRLGGAPARWRAGSVAARLGGICRARARTWVLGWRRAAAERAGDDPSRARSGGLITCSVRFARTRTPRL